MHKSNPWNDSSYRYNSTPRSYLDLILLYFAHVQSCYKLYNAQTRDNIDVFELLRLDISNIETL